MDMSYLR